MNMISKPVVFPLISKNKIKRKAFRDNRKTICTVNPMEDKPVYNSCIDHTINKAWHSKLL